MDEGDAVGEVEFVHHEGLTLVQVDGAGVQGGRGPTGIRGAEQTAGLAVHDGHGGADAAAHVHVVVWMGVRGDVPAACAGPRRDPAPDPALRGQVGEDSGGAELLGFGIGQREFGGRAQQLGAQHVGVGGVGDGGLDGLVQQRVGVMDEVRVEGVVGGHEQHQRPLATPARAARLLPERGHGAGETRDDNGVQARDVDAQFQRVGRRRAEQPAVGQRRLEFAPVLGQVAGSVGGHALGQPWIDLAQ
ncbi:Uncharacterised protein [Mycobacteroides abscessus subsp. abscessus]|nr:Uncharacterised protein [Mycobacteroides abscessus subsp. abscessus]